MLRDWGIKGSFGLADKGNYDCRVSGTYISMLNHIQPRRYTHAATAPKLVAWTVLANTAFRRDTSTIKTMIMANLAFRPDTKVNARTGRSCTKHKHAATTASSTFLSLFSGNFLRYVPPSDSLSFYLKRLANQYLSRICGLCAYPLEKSA